MGSVAEVSPDLIAQINQAGTQLAGLDNNDVLAQELKAKISQQEMELAIQQQKLEQLKAEAEQLKAQAQAQPQPQSLLVDSVMAVATAEVMNIALGAAAKTSGLFMVPEISDVRPRQSMYFQTGTLAGLLGLNAAANANVVPLGLGRGAATPAPVLAFIPGAGGGA